MAFDEPPARWTEFITANRAFVGAAVFALYVITARFGLMIHPVHGFATLIWPPTGLAILALLIGGYALWPAIALGAFVANYSLGASFAVALGIALGNTLEAYLGAYLLRRHVGLEWSFPRLRDSLGMILVALAAPLVSASIGVLSLLVGGTLTLDTVPPTWLAWWLGDVLGALVIVPLVLSWIARPVAPPRVTKLFEWAIMGLLLVAVSLVIFWTRAFPDVYPLAIPLGLIAMRTGARGVTLAVLVFAIIGIIGTITGHGVFALPLVPEGMLLLQFAVAVGQGLFLIFSSLMAERQAAIQALEGHVGTLESALDKTRLEDRAKNEFLAILAHELRNPLAPILSTLEYLKLKEAEQSNIEMITGAEQQAQVMRRLLDDLLDVSRVTQKRFKLKRQLIPLQAPLEQSLQAVRPFMKTQEHTLVVSLPGEDLWLNADPACITQIFTNILYNAAKYTKRGGRIELTVWREGAEAVASVRDNGVGIPLDMLDHIFEPFVSAHMATEVGTGLGIGLSLTRRLLEMHGGTIKAESAGPGTGSTFTLRLPLAPETPLSLSNQKKKAKPRTQTRESLDILIVDDNAAAAQGLARLLEHEGHHVSLAYTGAEALAAARSSHPAVMLVDIGLPDMSGYDIARQLRKESELPEMLVALTGYGQESDKRRARAAGFHHHLTKPVGIRDLVDLLNTLHQDSTGREGIL